ncbi:zinc finger, CCHC-type containing protein [Tanacetum coccineum]
MLIATNNNIISDDLEYWLTNQNWYSKKEGEEACAICLKDFKLREQLTELGCRHYYHGSCIKEWLTRKNQCPLCRRPGYIVSKYRSYVEALVGHVPFSEDYRWHEGAISMIEKLYERGVSDYLHDSVDAFLMEISFNLLGMTRNMVSVNFPMSFLSSHGSIPSGIPIVCIKSLPSSFSDQTFITRCMRFETKHDGCGLARVETDRACNEVPPTVGMNHDHAPEVLLQFPKYGPTVGSTLNVACALLIITAWLDITSGLYEQAEPEKDKCHEDTGKKWPLSLLRRYQRCTRSVSIGSIVSIKVYRRVKPDQATRCIEKDNERWRTHLLKTEAEVKDCISRTCSRSKLIEYAEEVSLLCTKVMAEEDAFLVDNIEGGLCVDYTDTEIVGRCNSGSDKDKGKYIAEDSSSKKFLVSNFNNYKMVNSRPAMEQYNELLKILGQYTQYGLKMDESISVSSIIDKLPPSWKDFKHTLKHGKDVLSLVQLDSHLHIEESLRAQDSDKGKGKKVAGPSVNMTEEGKNKNNKQNKSKKCGFNANNSGSSSNKKPKLEC